MKLKSTGKSREKYLLLENGTFYLVAETTKKIDYKKPSSRLFSYVQEKLPTSDIKRYSKPMDLSNLRVFTFLVVNNGLNPVTCQVEISPDGENWGTFGELEINLSPDEKQVIIPQYFLRYARIKFKSKNLGFHSMVTVWFQGQY